MMQPSAPTRSGSVVEQISRLVADDKVELPPFPDVVFKIQEMLRAEDSSAQDLADLVSHEPALATEVLRIANSAAYGGLRQISEMRQAVARLGLSQVATVVTALASKQQFSDEDPQRNELMQALWDHSVATALAARFLAERADADPEAAFLGGLLHDTGKLLVIRSLDVLREQGIDVPATEDVLDELMEALHSQLGHVALKMWNLPDELAEIALHHHDEDVHEDAVILLCVQAGNLVARKLGFHPHPDPDLELLQEPAIEALGLADLSLAALMIDLEDEIEKKNEMFGGRSRKSS